MKCITYGGIQKLEGLEEEYETRKTSYNICCLKKIQEGYKS